MITLDTMGSFTWNYGQKFFIETIDGNYVWSDPDYNGDNKIVLFNGTYEEWLKLERIPYGRDKGKHTIRGYCGEGVRLPFEGYVSSEDARYIPNGDDYR